MFGVMGFITSVMYAQEEQRARLAEDQRIMAMPEPDRTAYIKLMQVRAHQRQADATYSQASATRNQELSIF